MPYIIHTFTENRWPPDHERRAVATLDEAQEEAYWEAFHTGPLNRDEAMVDSCHDIPEQGGTVGPLPDGTVIEVERVEYGQLHPPEA